MNFATRNNQVICLRQGHESQLDREIQRVTVGTFRLYGDEAEAETEAALELESREPHEGSAAAGAAVAVRMGWKS